MAGEQLCGFAPSLARPFSSIRNSVARCSGGTSLQGVLFSILLQLKMASRYWRMALRAPVFGLCRGLGIASPRFFW
jgi:hypothetical protein